MAAALEEILQNQANEQDQPKAGCDAGEHERQGYLFVSRRPWSQRSWHGSIPQTCGPARAVMSTAHNQSQKSMMITDATSATKNPRITAMTSTARFLVSVVKPPSMSVEGLMTVPRPHASPAMKASPRRRRIDVRQ